MMQLILIGIGAGVATALLFASVASGAASLHLPVLSRAAPDPDRGARLEPLGGAGRGGDRGGRPRHVPQPVLLHHIPVGIGLPAWWLGYLALLGARPDAPGGMEWYPVGRIVVWAAILGAGVVIAAIPNFGLDEESFRSGLRNVFERMLRAQTRASADGAARASRQSMRTSSSISWSP